MPIAYIDDQAYEFESGTKLLQFCLDHGLELPHFCYHPAMSAPANCRQCLVEVGIPVKNRQTGEQELDDDGNPVIRFFPKLETSCSMDLAPGMVVKTHRTSKLVEEAQKSNLEFLLINHPLDCPICDQAGICPLQNQAYKYGPEGSRFEFEKVHKPKHIPLGPRVMLDGERCINCTRCTRFTNEVSKSKQLTIISRGVKNYPMTPPGQDFDDPYSMNVIDICPVGALTSTDFRFRARPWEMSHTPSISVHTSKGVNVSYWVRDNQILRLTPRNNLAVNDFWIADADRLDYRKFNENRPQQGPQVNGETTNWKTTIARVAGILAGTDGNNICFLGSAYATVEDNYLLKRLAGTFGAGTPRYIPHIEMGYSDGWLLNDDRTPNAQGCERLGILPIDVVLLKAKMQAGEIKVLYVMEDDPIATGLFTAAELDDVAVVLHYHNTTNQTLPHATVALPTAMAVETIGTMVNEAGRAQRLRPAKVIKTMNRSLMMETGQSRLDKHGTPFDRWYNEDNKIDCRPSWDLLQNLADKLNEPMRFKSPNALMTHIAETEPAFKGATYDAMGLEGVQLADVGVPA